MRVVVAGSSDREPADELFERRSKAANELGADLDVIHAWKLNSGYDDIISRRVSEASCNRDQKDSDQADAGALAGGVSGGPGASPCRP